MKKERIIAKCKSLDLEYNFGENIIYIKSKLCSWRIVICNDNTYELWHQNIGVRANNYKNKSFTGGFHRQFECKEKRNIYAILEYIQGHDRRSLNKYKRKTAVDKMFEFTKKPRFVMF